MIRTAKEEDIAEIKAFVDSSPEVDAEETTYTEEYFGRLLEEQILLVDEQEGRIMGVCFGTFNEPEGWADLLAVVVDENLREEGVGSALVKRFQELMPPGVRSIDTYASAESQKLFDNLGYERRRSYVAYRKYLRGSDRHSPL